MIRRSIAAGTTGGGPSKGEVVAAGLAPAAAVAILVIVTMASAVVTA